MTGADDPLVDEQADGVLDVARLVALVIEADEPVGADLLVVDGVLLLLGLLSARVTEAACGELEHRVAVPGPVVGGRPEELGVAGTAGRRTPAVALHDQRIWAIRARGGCGRQDHVYLEWRPIEALQPHVRAAAAVVAAVTDADAVRLGGARDRGSADRLAGEDAGYRRRCRRRSKQQRRDDPSQDTSPHRPSTIGGADGPCAGSADQEAAPEHPLERLAVAVALDAPPGQGEVARRLQMEIDALAVAVETDLADRLVAATLEVLSEPEDHRTAGNQVLVPGASEARHLAELRRSLAVVAADLGDQRTLPRVKAGKLGGDDQVARVLVVIVVGDGHPDVVEHAGGPQELTLAVRGFEHPARGQGVEHLQR